MMKRQHDPDRVLLGGELSVSRLGFGTIRLTEGRGFGAVRKNAVQLLRKAADLGVDFFDTADSYGAGAAESVIAQALYPYDGLTIATKGGYEHPEENKWRENGRPEHLRLALEGSLKRLRLDQMTLYFLHVPDPNVPYDESLDALKTLQLEGKIRFIGVSNVNIEELHIASRVLGDKLVAVQNYYNVMFHHGAERFYPTTEAVLDECERHEWVFVAWEPMGTGHGLPDVDDTEFFRQQAIHEIEELASHHGVSTHTVRLAAVLSRSRQIIAIPGTQSVEHLQANMEALKLSTNTSSLGPWLMQRRCIISDRESTELDELQRRLTEPVNDYSADVARDARSPLERKTEEDLAVKLAAIADLFIDDVVTTFLAYQDRPGALPSDRQDTLHREHSRDYAEGLRGLVHLHGPYIVSKAVMKLLRDCHEIVRRVAIDVSPYGKSISWACWDLGKQFHFVQNPRLADARYTIADPVLVWPKFQEICDRHIGWEVFEHPANVRDKHALSADSEIQVLIKKGTDARRLSSFDLARLGLLVRTRLAGPGSRAN
jgi:pyridoxine 4-dehydrogenase